MAAKPDATTEVLTSPPADAMGPGKPEVSEELTTPTYPDPTDGGEGFDPSAGGYDPSAMGDPAQIMAMMGPFMAIFLIIGLLIAVFSIFCWWKIFSKAGHNGALSLIFIAGIIPLIGPLICLGLFIWFTFSDWPALKGQAAKA